MNITQKIYENILYMYSDKILLMSRYESDVYEIEDGFDYDLALEAEIGDILELV